jgi:alkyl hydroperoxide reductase subunit AhpC
MKRIINNIVIVFFLLFCNLSFSLISIGEKVSAFKLTSGSDKHLFSSDLKGKIVTIFYETKETTEVNRLLKNELNKFYYSHLGLMHKNVVRLAVIDASSANLFTKFIWKRKMRNASSKEKLTIYGDWDGSMRKAFKIPKNSIAFFITDKKGVIRYIKSGRVAQFEIGKIKELLNSLVLQAD